jgi:hypothetical protein
VSLHAREVERAWNKLGMVRKNTDDYHVYFYYKGKMILWSKRSFGSGKIEGNLPHKLRLQLKLTPSEFDKLVDCSIKLPEYVEILKKKGWIEEDPHPEG